MRLSALLRDVPHEVHGPAGDPELSSVTHDSRAAGPGVLFAAFPGTRLDGRSFVADAARRGAPAAIGEPPPPAGLTVPYRAVAEPRRVAGFLAAQLAGRPSDALTMVGVTGTSGKTTTSLLLDAALSEAHPSRGLFGTLVYRFGAEAGPVDAARTTPEATELQPMLAALAARGGTAAVLECSSHALALERLAGCRFDAALFLNLSRDHLDFHGDFARYFEAKALLFGMLKPRGVAVVNADDPWGRRLLERIPREAAVSFSLRPDSGADVLGEALLGGEGIELRVARPSAGEAVRLVSPLLGRPNAENLLAAAAAALTLGVPAARLGPLLASVRSVPGRLESVPNEAGLLVLVDYAHKPGALEGVLETVRPIARARGGRVVVLFGCGGDRDRGKRPEMGRIAARGADVVVVTSDNPRSEDPLAILDEIRAGVAAEGKDALYLPDRREAIAAALDSARPGDVVLLAGKGHETTQVAAGVKHPFDDRVVAAEELRALEARARKAAAGGDRRPVAP